MKRVSIIEISVTSVSSRKEGDGIVVPRCEGSLPPAVMSIVVVSIPFYYIALTMS